MRVVMRGRGQLRTVSPVRAALYSPSMGTAALLDVERVRSQLEGALELESLFQGLDGAPREQASAGSEAPMTLASPDRQIHANGREIFPSQRVWASRDLERGSRPLFSVSEQTSQATGTVFSRSSELPALPGADIAALNVDAMADPTPSFGERRPTHQIEPETPANFELRRQPAAIAVGPQPHGLTPNQPISDFQAPTGSYPAIQPSESAGQSTAPSVQPSVASFRPPGSSRENVDVAGSEFGAVPPDVVTLPAAPNALSARSQDSSVAASGITSHSDAQPPTPITPNAQRRTQPPDLSGRQQAAQMRIGHEHRSVSVPLISTVIGLPADRSVNVPLRRESPRATSSDTGASKWLDPPFGSEPSLYPPVVENDSSPVNFEAGAVAEQSGHGTRSPTLILTETPPSGGSLRRSASSPTSGDAPGLSYFQPVTNERPVGYPSDSGDGATFEPVPDRRVTTPAQALVAREKAQTSSEGRHVMDGVGRSSDTTKRTGPPPLDTRSLALPTADEAALRSQIRTKSGHVPPLPTQIEASQSTSRHLTQPNPMLLDVASLKSVTLASQVRAGSILRAMTPSPTAPDDTSARPASPPFVTAEAQIVANSPMTPASTQLPMGHAFTPRFEAPNGPGQSSAPSQRTEARIAGTNVTQTSTQPWPVMAEVHPISTPVISPRLGRSDIDLGHFVDAGSRSGLEPVDLPDGPSLHINIQRIEVRAVREDRRPTRRNSPSGVLSPGSSFPTGRGRKGGP